jgi:hypothetical protein
MAIALAACSEPAEDVDSGTDGSTVACAVAFEPASGAGSTDPLGAAAGEARAGRLPADAFPIDPTGLSTVRDDDFVLANDRVAVVVSDVGPGEVYDPYGGRIVAVSELSGGAFAAPADYGLVLLGVSRFLLATESVAVLSDGSSGGPAVVRATGTMTEIQALADLLDAVVRGDLEGMPAAMDYELAPDSDALDIYVTVRADERGVNASIGSVQAFFQGSRMPAWAPVTAFGNRGGAIRYLAFEDSDATSFAWMTGEDADVEPLIGVGGIDVIAGERVAIAGCTERRIHLGRMVIAGPGLPALQEAVAAIDGVTLRSISGRVVESDGDALVAPVRVHVTAADGEHLTRFVTDGSFDVNVDERAAQLWAWRDGEPLVGPVAIGSGETEIRMGAFGTISVTATDDIASQPLPVRVEVVPLDGAPPSVPETFGEHPPGAGRSHIAFPTDGVVSLRVSPGHHRVIVTRGPEYDRFEIPDQQVDAGADVPVAVSLARVVNTPGVMCADYHIHTHRSVDSSDPGMLKVAALVADGLEIAIRSEHEWVSDFGPVVRALGLQDFALGMAGLELTTFTWGHFGVFPLTPDPTMASGGAVPWYERLAPDVFDEVRDRAGTPALIINHPRAGGIRQGYFTEAGYDPTTGTVARPELWDEEFSIVEVFNSSDFESNRESTVVDWFSLLSSGRHVFAVGSSDSHDVTSAPVGYPRTCLRVGVDVPGGLTPEMVRDATQEGRSIVSGGIYLEIAGPGGVQPGGEATSTGAVASFRVVVRAAPWVDVDRLEVFVDGAPSEMITIDATDTDPLDATSRLDTSMSPIEVDVAAAGSWVVFHASGDDPVDSNGNRPFAVSNPIFLSR